MLEVLGQVSAFVRQGFDGLQQPPSLLGLGAGSLGGDLSSTFEGPVGSLRLGIRPACEPACLGVRRREGQQHESQGPGLLGGPLEGDSGGSEALGDQPVAQGHSEGQKETWDG